MHAALLCWLLADTTSPSPEARLLSRCRTSERYACKVGCGVHSGLSIEEPRDAPEVLPPCHMQTGTSIVLEY